MNRSWRYVVIAGIMAASTSLSVGAVLFTGTLWPLVLVFATSLATSLTVRSWWTILSIAIGFSVPVLASICAWFLLTDEGRTAFTEGDFSGNEGMMFVPVFYFVCLIILIVVAVIGVYWGGRRSLE